MAVIRGYYRRWYGPDNERNTSSIISLLRITDEYYSTDNKNTYWWDGSAWNSIGNSSPTGPAGNPGDPGSPGPTGPSGSLGPTGANGLSIHPILVQIVDPSTDVDTLNGIFNFLVPSSMNGMNLTRAIAMTNIAGITGSTTIQVRNMTKYSGNDALSVPITIASGQTIATIGTINTSYDDISGGDIIKIYVTGQSTTKPKGLQIILEYT